MKEAVEREHAQAMVEVVRAALHDPFLPVRLAGERLVGAFDLAQFRADIQTDAQSAPLIMQRELAQRVLKQLQSSEK